MVKFILDPGSTHIGKKEYVREIIKRASGVGAHAVKFQLFSDTEEQRKRGNIPLSEDLYVYACDIGSVLGIEVTASVFDQASLAIFEKHTLPDAELKIAFSMNLSETLNPSVKRKLIISCDDMSLRRVKKRWDGYSKTLLYCISEYPVKHMVHFGDRFTRLPFSGFSDHTIGYDQTYDAIRAGAKIIEKHVKLHYDDIDCPDANFAIDFEEAGRMILESPDRGR